MNFVSTVTSKVDQFRNRLFLSSLHRSQKVVVQTARLSVSRGQTIKKYRVRILVRASGLVEAELNAETRLQEILRGFEEPPGGEIELKKLMPRELTQCTVDDESESIIQLLQKMRRESSHVVSAIAPIETS